MLTGSLSFSLCELTTSNFVEQASRSDLHLFSIVKQSEQLSLSEQLRHGVER